MGKLFKVLLGLIVLGGVATGIYALASSGKKGDGGMKIVVAEAGSITEKALAVGQIQPRQKFSVKSKISGIVKGCLVDVGRPREGRATRSSRSQPDPTPHEVTDVDRQLDSAKASFERARAEFDRAQELSKAGRLPESDLDVKREAFELAEDRASPRPSRTAT